MPRYVVSVWLDQRMPPVETPVDARDEEDARAEGLEWAKAWWPGEDPVEVEVREVVG